MLWQKSCPRCRGDLVLDRDLDGPFIGCIQCGAVLSERQEQALLRLAPRHRHEQARARLTTEVKGCAA
jgi:transcription initiation factor TFIIIB Brf1 subunit/transcription initiation factor TFIIB